MALADDLRALVDGEVFSDDATLARYSYDASIFVVRPEVVVAPKHVEDIKAIVRYVSEHKATNPKLSVTVRSAGTDMSGGPLGESIILDMLPHFQGVVSIDADKQKAVVLPGTFYRDFEKATLAQGLLLPCYTASRELNTVGGMGGNNSGGEKTLSYGKTEDDVIELKMVLADGEEHTFRAFDRQELEATIHAAADGGFYGEVLKLVTDNEEEILAAKPAVSKNSAGYALWNIWDRNYFDLNRLFVGSQGTLGIVTEITFKLVKPKEHSTLLVVFLSSTKWLPAIVQKILSYHPESFESYDNQTIKIALRYFPSLLKLIGAKNMLKLAWDFRPEFFMVVTGGMPELVMIAEFTGDSEEIIYKHAQEAGDGVRALQIPGARVHLTHGDEEERKFWTVRRKSFELLRSHVSGKRTMPFVDDIVVAPAKLADFLPKLSAILKQYDITYTIAGHVGNGNFHIIPLMDMRLPRSREIVPELSSKVYALVREFSGSITGEHNDGFVRTPYLGTMYSPNILKLFAQVKNIFDPLNIFNPGKKVPVGENGAGTLAYLKEHLAHDNTHN